MQILGEAINSSDVISSDDVITTLGQPDDVNTQLDAAETVNNVDIGVGETVINGEGQFEDMKLVYEPVEGVSSSVLYMCCVCNKLFTEQTLVNSHMEIEHGSEAVIGQDFSEMNNISQIIEQPDGFPHTDSGIGVLDEAEDPVSQTLNVSLVSQAIATAITDETDKNSDVLMIDTRE